MQETNIIKRCVQQSHNERLLETCLPYFAQNYWHLLCFYGHHPKLIFSEDLPKKGDVRDEIQKLLQVEVVQKHKN